jgi:hypothetical protein
MNLDYKHLPNSWDKFLIEYLDSFGLKYDAFSNWHEKTVAFTKFLTRRIPLNKRNIFISNEFNIPEGFEEKLEEIKDDIKLGNDLNCYTSKTTLNASYNDYLYNDWNIHHFHLGGKIEGKNFSGRSGFLLYLLIEKDAVYFLNILPHEKWAYIEFLNIINRNWKFLIEDFILKNVLNIKPEIKTDEEVLMMREHNINIVITLEDESNLMPPNFGYATEGSSIRAIMLKNKIVKQMFYFENYFEKKYGENFYNIEFKFEGYNNGIFIFNNYDDNFYKFYPFK